MLSGAVTLGLGACQQDDIGILNDKAVSKTDGALKDAADFPIGLAISEGTYKNSAAYREALGTHASSTTFGYYMKHGALVDDGGNVNFTNADEIFNAVTAQGVDVFGHTLGWHTNQNADYLKTIVGGGSGPTAVNLISNGGFDTDLSSWSVQNTGDPSGTSSFSHTTVAGEVRTGSGALKVITDKDYGSSQWRVQIHTSAFATESGKSYKVSFWIKAASGTGSIRLSLSPASNATPSAYQGDQTVTTAWTQISFIFTKTAAETTKISFDIGNKANTYFIDDVMVVDAAASVPPVGEALVTAVSGALNDFITKTVTHYKGKVSAWDVVNEAIADNGSLRTDENTTVPQGATDYFFWSKYLGEDWVLKAFQYAEAADPDALLFINDYNLEYSTAKLDGLIALVNKMKAKGAKIDGIGTQMHISINTSYAMIDKMFEKLAATGLLIRISELDVRANPYDKPDFSYLTHAQAIAYQANMYEYVVKSYLKHVPAAQRHGITVWGIHDPDSWIVVYQNKIDAPLMFDANMAKKSAFYAVKNALEAGQ